MEYRTEAIQTVNLTKKYRDVIAVDNLNLTVQSGELFSLLGVNGAGKTTTIKMLSCLTQPTCGDAFLGGNSIVSHTGKVKSLIGVSPQEIAVAPNLTVEENLAFLCGVHGFGSEKKKDKIIELSRQFDLQGFLHKKAGKLSGGWQRRLSIAMALISDPEILFLDEPTLGLDVIARSELWDTIRSLKGKTTIILTTHYMEEAEALSDRIGILKDGRLLALGTAAELKEMTDSKCLEDAFISIVARKNNTASLAKIREAFQGSSAAFGNNRETLQSASASARQKPAASSVLFSRSKKCFCTPCQMSGRGGSKMRLFAFSDRTAKEILRDPLNLGFGLGFPIILLLLLSAIQANIPVSLFEIESLTPGITVFGLSFMTLFSATLISRDRESALLQRLYTTPLTAADFILGYALPILPCAAAQSAICYLFALLLGLPGTVSIIYAIVSILPVSLFFIALGLLCGSIFNVKQVGGICGALLTNLSAWLSGVWFDLDLVGGLFKKIAYGLPFVHAVELERAVLSGSYADILPHFFWVAGYTAAVMVIAILLFLRQMTSDR